MLPLTINVTPMANIDYNDEQLIAKNSIDDAMGAHTVRISAFQATF